MNSQATGNWSSTSTWDGGFVPAACNAVNIVVGTTVTVDTSAMASTTTITGNLVFSRTVNSTMTIVGGNVNVNAGGTLDLGTSGSPIPSSLTSTLILSSGPTAGQYGLIVNSGGNFLVYGATKAVSAPLTSNASAGAGNIQVATTGLSWNAGDVITVDTEAVTIQSLTSSQINFTPNLGQAHSLRAPPSSVISRATSSCARRGLTPARTRPGSTTWPAIPPASI